MRKFYAILVICLLLSGCASVTYRTDSLSITEISPGAYPGFRADINFMKQAVKGEIESSHSLLDPIIFTSFMIDAPLSFLVDTICLPYDIFQIGKDNREGEMNVSTEDEAIK